MDLQGLSNFVSNVGIPGALLIYLVWRLDRFLSFLCAKLTTYNKEFSDIAYAIHGVIEEIKDLKESLITQEKK